MSPGHLSALCRATLRRSAGRVLRERLALEARRLLAYSDLTATTVMRRVLAGDVVGRVAELHGRGVASRTSPRQRSRHASVCTGRVSPALKAGLEDGQRRLHARAATFAGCIAGRDPRRAERARELVRARPSASS